MHGRLLDLLRPFAKRFFANIFQRSRDFEGARNGRQKSSHRDNFFTLPVMFLLHALFSKRQQKHHQLHSHNMTLQLDLALHFSPGKVATLLHMEPSHQYNLHHWVLFESRLRIEIGLFLILIQLYVPLQRSCCICLFPQQTQGKERQSQVLLPWNNFVHHLQHPVTHCSRLFHNFH